MKRFLYSLCLIVSLTGLSSCKDDDPAPVSPVVGRWEINRGLLSGFTAPNQGANGASIDLYYFLDAYASTIDVRADKSFTNNTRSGGIVSDADGTWEFTNNELTLTYDDPSIDAEAYTYNLDRGIEELTSSQLDFSLDSTSRGKIQVIYRK